MRMSGLPLALVGAHYANEVPGGGERGFQVNGPNFGAFHFKHGAILLSLVSFSV